MSGFILLNQDARSTPHLEVDCIITDPVWPNVPEGMFDMDCSPRQLLLETLRRFKYKRLAIVMRLDSDPRFLTAVDENVPFFRLVNLPYVSPGYIGRKLGGIEHAYLFGEPPKSAPGRRVIPGEAPRAQPGGVCKDHPCARNIDHMRWLVRWWSEVGEVVCDPFAGSGTIGMAALEQGREFYGIEIDPTYHQIAEKRLKECENQQRLEVY